MYEMTRTKALLCVLVLLSVPMVVSAQERAGREERARGLYIDVGLGVGGMRYLNDGKTKAIAEGFDQAADSHITVDLSILTIGGALRDNFYIVGTIAGVGDGYFDAADNQSQITIAMYGFGIRWYPLPSKKHLQLGLDLGANTMQVTYGWGPNKREEMSDVGYSARASVGWDFDSTMTGFALMAGGDVMFNVIEDDKSLSYALFLKLLFK